MAVDIPLPEELDYSGLDVILDKGPLTGIQEMVTYIDLEASLGEGPLGTLYSEFPFINTKETCQSEEKGVKNTSSGTSGKTIPGLLTAMYTCVSQDNIDSSQLDTEGMKLFELIRKDVILLKSCIESQYKKVPVLKMQGL